jgi:hypothetical protein
MVNRTVDNSLREMGDMVETILNLTRLVTPEKRDRAGRGKGKKRKKKKKKKKKGGP